MPNSTSRLTRRCTDDTGFAKGHLCTDGSRRKAAIAPIVLTALLLTVLTVWITLTTRKPPNEIESTEPPGATAPAAGLPALPWSATGTVTSPDRLPRFRFPGERDESTDHRPDWRLLGSNGPANEGYPMIRGSLRHRILHFTFDDGPSINATSQILDWLSEYNVRATFFVVGKHLFGPDAQGHRNLLKRMEQNGHTIAVHSYSHRDLRYLSDSQIQRELYRTRRMMETTLAYSPGLFRPPYGGHNERTDALLKSSGYTGILWNIAPDEFGARTPWEIASNFHSALHDQEQNDHGPGGIVLLHDNRVETAGAIPLLMEELRRRNCALLDRDGEELWDVVGDLSYFLLYRDGLPDALVAKRQKLARAAARKYCVGVNAGHAPAHTEPASRADTG